MYKNYNKIDKLKIIYNNMITASSFNVINKKVMKNHEIKKKVSTTNYDIIVE